MASGTSVGKIFVELGLSDKDFVGGANRAVRTIELMTNSFGALRNVINTAVIGSFRAAISVITEFGVSSVTTGEKFEQAIITVGAVAGATSEQLQKLEDQARLLGSTTQFTATESADAMATLARSGLKTNQIIAASGPAMLLAGASGGTMNQSTMILASTLAQFTMNASEASRISDVFSTALRNSLFDMTSLTEAMKFAGTTGASFGMSLEETTAAVAQFRDLGLEGSLAGTNFRMALAAAAAPSEKAKKALEKYGLTVADINPEINDFATIMTNVGEAGISTADALTIFGRRAGANVATISREFAAGTTRFNSLLQELETSAGATEQLYNEMGQTVQFQFKVLVSALEELRLVVFDIFREPLRELLMTMSETIAITARTLKLHTKSVAINAKEALGSVADFIKENQFILAQFMKTIINVFKTMAQGVVSLLPLLDEFAVAMGTAFVAVNVTALVAGFQALVVNMAVVVKSIKGLIGVITVLTGGTASLVVGVLAAVTAFVALSTESAKAADKVNSLERAFKKYKAIRDAIDDMDKSAADFFEKNQPRRIRGLRDQLEAEGQLSKAMEGRLKFLSKMTSDQIKERIALGQLVAVMHNGKQVFVDVTTATALMTGNSSMAAEATEALGDAFVNSQTAVQQASAQFGPLDKMLKEYDKQVARGVSETLLFSGAIAQEGEDIADVRERHALLQESLEKSVNRYEGLGQAIEAAQDEMLREKAARESNLAENKEESAAAAAAAKEREAAEKALAKAIEERTEAEVDLLEPLSSIADMSEDEVLAEFQARLEAFEQASATEIAARKKLGQDIERLEAIHRQKVAEQRIFFAVEMERRDQEIRLQAEEETAELIEKLRRKDDKKRLTELEKVAKQKAEALEEAEKASAEQIEEIYNIFTRREIDAITAHQIEVERVIRPHQQRLVELEAEKNHLLRMDQQAGGENQLAITRHFNKLIREEERRAAAERKTFGFLMGQAFTAVGDAAVKAGRTVVNEVRGMTDSITGFLTDLTEFEFNLFDAVSDVKSEMAEVADLQESLAAGEITQAEFNEAMLELPATIEDSARGFVQELTQGVQDNISLFIEAAPILLMELGRALPGIIQNLADAIPDIVDSIVTTLPEILQALAANIPSLVKAITDEIPTIIEVVLNEIPTIIKAFGEAIPVILTTLAEGVAQILAEVPKILRTILNQLPTIITAIFESIDTIIIALVEAIPKMVNALIAHIPTIIRALIQGLLGSLSTIIVEVLGTLIPTLIAMIPEIVSVIMTALSVVIETLVARLPFIIAQLIRALDSIVNGLITLIPKVLAAFIRGLPRLVTAIVSLIPAVIEGLIKALPKLISTLVTMFTQFGIIEIVISLVAELVPAVIAAAPRLIVSLIELVVIEIPMMVGVFVVEFVKAIPKIIQEIVRGIGESLFNLGKGIKNAFSGLGNFFSGIFGDTPGVQRAGAFGSFAGFAPGDYFAAAQSPNQLLAQALSVASPSAIQAIQAPGMEGLSVAMMQMASAIQSNGMRPAMAGQSVAVTIKADGQVLDRVMYNAGQNGNAPYAEKRARKSTLQAGRQPGFDRGKYRGG